ncbi:hypothetical protein EJB05_27261, partial [Eragrostis curvula]
MMHSDTSKLLQRHTKLRLRSASGKLRISHCHDLEYPSIKKSRKGLPHQEHAVILTDVSEHALVCEMDTAPANNDSQNSCSQLSGHIAPSKESVANVDETDRNNEILCNIVHSENERVETHPMQALQGKNDVPDKVQIQLMEKNSIPNMEISRALSVSPKRQTILLPSKQVLIRTNSSSNMKVYAKKCIDIHDNLLEEESTAMVIGSCQSTINAAIPTDTAVTQVSENNHHTELSVPSVENVLQGGDVMEERSECTISNTVLKSTLDAGSSTLSDLTLCQNADHELPFVKKSKVWPQVEAILMDIFKEKAMEELRCKGQELAMKKEHEDAELSKLKAADMSIKEACGGTAGWNNEDFNQKKSQGKAKLFSSQKM